MTLKSTVRKIIRKRANFSAWMGYTQWQLMKALLYQLFQRALPTSQERFEANQSFQEVAERLALSENDLSRQQKHFKQLTLFWLSLFALAVVYALYFVILNAWLAALLVVALSLMMLCQAFQYHFWYFQIKKRRLNCSLNEWIQETFQKKQI